MSCIYFHSLDGEARVSGCERNWYGCSHTAPLFAALGLDRAGDTDTPQQPHFLRPVIPWANKPGVYGDAWFESVRLGLAVPKGFDGASKTFRYREQDVGVWQCELNTVIAGGSDPVRLLARLHAQCEIHAYVEGPNRAWLARIVREGIAAGILRQAAGWDEESGWEAVAALLESGQEHPVVTSYSVCEQFPDPDFALDAGTFNYPGADEGHDEAFYAAWEALSEDGQWDCCMESLRSDAGYTVEMKPENWATYYFGAGVNGYQIRSYAVSLNTNEWGPRA